MNFMGGGRRSMKMAQKDHDEDKEKVINYIQKQIDEKIKLESKGKSIFKANDKKVVNQSQDVIKAKVISKIYSKPSSRPKPSIMVRQVLTEKTVKNGTHSIPKIFKHNRKSKNWEDRILKTIRVEKEQLENNNLINVEQPKENLEERFNMTFDWVKKVNNSHGSSQTYIRTYV